MKKKTKLTKSKTKKLTPKKIKIIIAATSSTIMIALIAALFIISPAIPTDSITKPTVRKTEEYSNSHNYELSLEGETGIYVDYNGKDFSSPDQLTKVTEINEGKQTFKVYKMKNFFLFRLISKEYKEVIINFDFTPPQILYIDNVNDEYYRKENIITFETDEVPLTIKYKNNDVEKKFTFKNDETPIENNICEIIPIEESDNFKFTCKVQLEEEGAYAMTFILSDELGNEYQIFNNSKVLYVIPVSLACKDVPDYTNKETFTKKCVVNKDGYYYKEEEQIEIKKDQEIEYTFTLQEKGENKINIKTGDYESRIFEEEYTINLDQTKPEFVDLSIPNSITVCDFMATPPMGTCIQGNTNITLSFKTNENISGIITTKVKPIPGYILAGSSSNKFTLKAGSSYNKIINALNYAAGPPFSEYSPHDIVVNIKITDQAGNSTSYSKTIDMKVRY